jgi:hypothetical protein
MSQLKKRRLGFALLSQRFLRATIILPEEVSVLGLPRFFDCTTRRQGFVAEWAHVNDAWWVHLEIQHA